MGHDSLEPLSFSRKSVSRYSRPGISVTLRLFGLRNGEFVLLLLEDLSADLCQFPNRMFPNPISAICSTTFFVECRCDKFESTSLTKGVQLRRYDSWRWSTAANWNCQIQVFRKRGDSNEMTRRILDNAFLSSKVERWDTEFASVAKIFCWLLVANAYFVFLWPYFRIRSCVWGLHAKRRQVQNEGDSPLLNILLYFGIIDISAVKLSVSTCIEHNFKMSQIHLSPFDTHLKCYWWD